MGFSKINYQRTWIDKVDQFEKELREDPEKRWGGRVNGQEFRQALGSYKLVCFAERLRNRDIATWDQQPQAELLRLYLINKHHWTLEQARQVQDEKDFLLVLRNELEQLKLNAAEADPVKNSVGYREGFLDFADHYESNS